MSLFLIVLVTLLLAAANGANDNIKGAATLLGSGLVRYRTAIALATIATALGGVVSIYLAHDLMVAFSGKGIVPEGTTSSLPFLLSVGVAAGATVWVATRFGLPVSTTHALLGGLLGAGFAAVPGGVHLGAALKSILLPLLLSPVVALLLSIGLIPLLRRARARAAAAAPCICVEATTTLAANGVAMMAPPSLILGYAGDAACQPSAVRDVHAADGVAWIDHHRFEAGKPLRVCSNTFDMLARSRYAVHFVLAGDTSTHFGLFDCAPAPAGALTTDCSTGCC